jgi:hypothetical protein
MLAVLSLTRSCQNGSVDSLYLLTVAVRALQFGLRLFMQINIDGE